MFLITQGSTFSANVVEKKTNILQNNQENSFSESPTFTRIQERRT